MKLPTIKLRPLLGFLLGCVAANIGSALEIVLDNASGSGVTITGAWTTSTNQAGYYGPNYIHDGATGKGAKSVLFTPTMTVSGSYEVFLYWSSGSSRANNVPVTITHAGGTTNIPVNEQLSGQQWVSVGTYSFSTGSSGSVLISNTGTASGSYVTVDAVKFVQVPASDIIMDNSSGPGVELVGAWTAATTTPGYYGADYLHDGDTAKGAKTARFTPSFPASGFYEVFARWPADATHASSAPFTVISATGNKTVQVNQQANGGQWVSLGVYGFNQYARGGVLVSTTGTSGYVVADAIKFAPVGAPAWTPAHLGDQVWLDWRAEDLAGLSDGTAVASWTDRVGGVTATQGTVSKRPIKQGAEVVFNNAQLLQFPQQSQAYLAHRALCIVFRIDLTGSGDGVIFSANGVGGGAERQPCVAYNRSTNTVAVQWITNTGSINGYNRITFTLPEDKNQWHCLVARRVNSADGPIHYASLDGKDINGNLGESQVAMDDWALPKTNTSVVGYLGDFRTSTPEIGLDSVIVIQDEVSLADAQRLAGWAMWRRGIQANLPSAHPYRNAAPVAVVPDYAFDESTKTEYDAMIAYWVNSAQSEAFKGTTLDTTGWNLIFEDQFDQHTVTNDTRGRGNWFAPVHGDPCGAATAVVPPLNTADSTLGTTGTPATYIQDSSTMTIRMQDSGGWKSGAFCSVNLGGFGRAWLYPYIEVRMKTGPSSTGNLKGSWPALWLKSLNPFYNLSESYLEYDFYEGYISDSKGYHNTIHNWQAPRLYPGRLLAHRYQSNYLGLVTPGWYHNVNLFDGQYHTYGVMVTPSYVINTFDGRETFRIPTPIEMRQPLWFLADLAMSGDVAQASGVYDMTIDYIKVYQNPSYDGYGINFAR